MYHGLFDILLIIIATRRVVITVNNLNSDVALGKTSAPFTCRDYKDGELYFTSPGRLVHQNWHQKFYLITGWGGTEIEQELFNFRLTNEKDCNLFDLKELAVDPLAHTNRWAHLCLCACSRGTPEWWHRWAGHSLHLLLHQLLST